MASGSKRLLDNRIAGSPGRLSRCNPTADANNDRNATTPTTTIPGGPPLAPVTDPPLSGRTTELSALTAALDASEQGSCQFVAVAGEPGIGKTRLLTAYADTALERGRTVLWGRSAESEGQVPLGVFASALDDFLRSAHPQSFASLDPDTVALLRTVLPALPSPRPAGTLGDTVEVERYRLHRAMRSLIELVSEPNGLLLVLDDLHWSDDGSLELCDHLLRHPPRSRLVLAMSYRPRQASIRLSRAMTRAAGVGGTTALELPPLGFKDACQLMRPELHPRAQHRLYRLSAGNPFYLNALRHCDERTQQTGAELSSCADLPEPVRAALDAELVALSPDHLLVAQAAALVGERAEPRVIAQVAELEVATVLVAVDQLVRRYLLKPTEVGGEVEFQHPLLRTAVYLSAGAGWRMAAHARAATALHDRGAAPASRAYHVERSAGLGEQDPVGVLAEAAAATICEAPATAAHWLTAALRMLPEQAEHSADRVKLLGMLARAQGISARLHESRATLHEVLRMIPGDDAEARAHTVGFCALVERLLGRHAEAQALILGELDNLRHTDGKAAAILTLELTAGRLLAGDPTGELPAGHDPLEIARRHDDKALLAAALSVAAEWARYTGEPAEVSLRHLDEASALIDAMPDFELARYLESTAIHGLTEMYLKPPVDSIRHLKRGLRLSRQTGQTHIAPYFIIALGTGYLRMGRLARAEQYFTEALETALLSRSNHLRMMALTQLGWVRTLMGRLDEGIALNEEATALAGTTRVRFARYASVALGHARIAAGDHAPGIALLELGLGGEDLPDSDPMNRPSWCELLTRAHLAQENLAEAAVWADRAAVFADRYPDLPMRGYAQLAQAQVALPTDPRRASELALAAVDCFTVTCERLYLGCAHLVASRAFGAMDQLDEAYEQLGMAQQEFERCGAGLYAEDAARWRRRLDVRVRRQTRVAQPERNGTGTICAELAHLTTRELEIAQLVAEGMTNREIANRLFVSVRTVEVHVGRVCRKLDVSVRGGVAGKLYRAMSPHTGWLRPDVSRPDVSRPAGRPVAPGRPTVSG